MRGSVPWGGPGNREGRTPSDLLPPWSTQNSWGVEDERPGRRRVPHIQAARACEQEPRRAVMGSPKADDLRGGE